MMTDELILMLDKFEAWAGKAPTKTLCGEEDYYKPIQYTQRWARRTDFFIDDLVPSKGFERYYYGKLDTAVTKEEELTDISEDALMSVLNGGGFNAVA